jgi:hypothetical protein
MQGLTVSASIWRDYDDTGICISWAGIAEKQRFNALARKKTALRGPWNGQKKKANPKAGL